MDIKELYVLLTANTSQFKSAMAGASLEADSFGGKMKGLATVAKDSFMVAGAAAAGFVVDAALQGEKYSISLGKLNQAQRDAGTTLPTAQLQAWQGQMEKLGLSYTQTNDGLATLTEAHVNQNDQLHVMTDAQNLATATGKPLAEALQAILLGAQGSGRALKMFGLNMPDVVETTKGLEKATQAVATAQLKYTQAVHDHGATSKSAEAALASLHDKQNKLADAQASYGNKLGGLDQILSQVDQRFRGVAAAAENTDPIHRATLAFQDAATVIGVQMQPALNSLADWIEGPGIAAINGLAAWVTGTLIPAFGQIGDWITVHIVPSFMQLVGWIKSEVLPRLADLWKSIQENVLPRLLSFGEFLQQWVIQPAISLAQAVLPPLIGALTFLADNFGFLLPAIAGAGAAWLAFKAIMIGGAIWDVVVGGFAAIRAALSGEFALALAEAGIEADAMWAAVLGPIGLVVGAIGIVAGVLVGLGGDADKTGAKITGMGIVSAQTSQQMARDWQTGQNKQQQAAQQAHDNFVNGYVNAKDQAAIAAAQTTQAMQAAYAQQKADAEAHFKAMDPKEYAIWKDTEALAGKVGLTGQAYITAMQDSNVAFAQEDLNTKRLTLDRQFLNTVIYSPRSGESGSGAKGAGSSPSFLPNLFPATAAGGIVTSPQTRLVGEAGSEAIIPLSKLPALMGTANGGGGGVSIDNVNINVKSTDPRQAAIEIRDELLNLARSQGRNSLLGSFG